VLKRDKDSSVSMSVRTSKRVRLATKVEGGEDAWTGSAWQPGTTVRKQRGRKFGKSIGH
jgi:hypothetical protein